MAHGGLNKRRVRVNNPPNRRSTTKKFKPPVSLKNQIRSAERMLRKVTSLLSSHDYHPNPNPNSIFFSIFGIAEFTIRG
jgi:hypothetical protein